MLRAGRVRELAAERRCFGCRSVFLSRQEWLVPNRKEPAHCWQTGASQAAVGLSMSIRRPQPKRLQAIKFIHHRGSLFAASVY